MQKKIKIASKMMQKSTQQENLPEENDQLSKEDELILQLAGHILMDEWEEEWRELENESEYDPSPEAEEKLQQIVSQAIAAKREEIAAAKRNEQRQSMMRRAAIWTLVGFLVVGSAVTFAARAQIWSMFRKDHSEYSNFNARTPDEEQNTLQAFWPTWLPEGMEMEDEHVTAEGFDRSYKHTNGTWLLFGQRSLQAELTIDTEDSEETEVRVHGQEAYLYTKEDRGILVWNNHIAIFTVMGNIDSDDLIRVAESCATPK